MDKAFDSFPSTRWSLLARLGTGSLPEQRAALGELLRRYMPAIQAYLTGVRRIAEHDAEDLMQGFLTSKVLDDALLQRAREERGSFRAFLVTALNHYVISAHRKATALKRDPGGHTASLENVQEVASGAPTPSRAFDVAWARELLAQVIRGMKQECAERARLDVWGVFEARVLREIMAGEPGMPYEELVRRFDLKSPAHASNILMTGKRMFLRHFRQVIAEYEPDEALIDEEIAGLQRILSGDRR